MPLRVSVPELASVPVAAILMAAVEVIELKLSIKKLTLSGAAMLTLTPPPGIRALLPAAGRPLDQLATTNQSPLFGPINVVWADSKEVEKSTKQAEKRAV